MSHAPRDLGLVRAVGTWGLCASIVNIVIGAGIFAVPGALAASAGPYAPLAYAACAVAVGSVAICFAEGGSRVPTSGGAYGYVQAAFGPLAGFLAGFLHWVSDVLACGGIAAGLAAVGAGLFAASLQPIARAAIVVGVLGAIAWINVRGVAYGARLAGVATVVKLVPLAAFLMVGVVAVRTANFASTQAPTLAGSGRALILALFAFTGMETPLGASGEVAEPSRTIPRALALSMPSVALLYVAIQVIATGILGPSLAGATAPLADAMARISPTLRLLMLAGMALSMLGWIASNLLGSPRLLFAFARDGLLPAALGRVHPRTRTPDVAILAHTSIAIALALTGTFAELAVLATLATAPLYIAACAAAWQLARKGVAHAGAPLGFRALGAAAVVGTASMVGIVVLAARVEIVGLAGLMAAGVVFYVAWTRAARRPRSTGR